MNRLTAAIWTFSILTAGLPALGAGHEEITVIPLGSGEIAKGTHDKDYRLPNGPRGVLRQPVVILVAQPIAGGENKARVPATLKFTIAGQDLPEWNLTPERTAYVINLDTIRANPKFAEGRLSVKVELATDAAGVIITMLGMPDPLLLEEGKNTSLNGPLSAFQQASQNEEVRDYFAALGDEFAGRHEEALSQYRKLSTAADPRVARFARRGIRNLSYLSSWRLLSGNFMEHYRLGLYLQFCGLFASAYDEFEECRILDPADGESQFRAAECLDRMTTGVVNMFKTLLYMDRAGEAHGEGPAATWHTLVCIQKKRDELVLHPNHIDEIKDNWLIAEKMVWASTRGAVRPSSAFYVIDDERPDFNYGPVVGPPPDIVEARGWWDAVICVRPRLPQEPKGVVTAAPPEIGPKGAAIASVAHDALWPDYLKAFYGCLRSAAEAAGQATGLPGLDDAIDCGSPPAPGADYAYRAALRYHFTPDILAGLNISDPPLPGSFLRAWMIEGPFVVTDQPQPQGRPARHVLDAIPPAAPPKTVHVKSDVQFIDLDAVLSGSPGSHGALARATTWVFSPEDQLVRMGLGQCDGMAVWLNGGRITDGSDYFASKLNPAEAVLPDTVWTSARLKRGWNEIRCVIETWPKPLSKGWGFSVSLKSLDGRPLPGLANVSSRPEKHVVPTIGPAAAGGHYAWPEVSRDYRRLLPRLRDEDLAKITGVSGLRLKAAASPFAGFVALDAPGRAASPGYRPPPTGWDAANDRDTTVNNVMDWAREATLVIGGGSRGDGRAVLLLKPEAIDAFLTLLVEADAAEKLFQGSGPAQRILGYVVIPFADSTRSLLAVEVSLGDEKKWPADEEDLLLPQGPFVPNRVQSPLYTKTEPAAVEGPLPTPASD